MKRAVTLALWILVLPGCFRDAEVEPLGSSGEETASSSSTSSSTTTTTTTSSGSTGDPGSSSSGSTTDPSSTGTDDTDSTGSTGIETPDPIVRWTFDDGTFDDTSTYNAELLGSAVLEPSPDGSSVRLDGSGSIDLSSAAMPIVESLPQITLTMVVYPEQWTLAQTNTMFAIGVPGDMDPTDNAFVFRVEDGKATVLVETGDGTDDTVFVLGDAPPLQEWHRVTFVLDGDEIAYFLDTAEISRTPVSTPDTMSGTFRFGVWSGGNTFIGALEELSVYSQALGAAQVSSL